MGAVPKPSEVELDHQFWNEFFMLEMADYTATQTQGRCVKDMGPAINAIGLRKVPMKKYK